MNDTLASDSRVAEVEDLDFEPGSFDAMRCRRLGPVLFPDPARALRSMRRALKSGGAALSLGADRAARHAPSRSGTS